MRTLYRLYVFRNKLLQQNFNLFRLTYLSNKLNAYALMLQSLSPLLYI